MSLSLPPVDERGQCTACGSYPNEPGHWCADCDGWPEYGCGPDREAGQRVSLAAPALSRGPGRTAREVCDSEYREAVLAGVFQGMGRGLAVSAVLLVVFHGLRLAA